MNIYTDGLEHKDETYPESKYPDAKKVRDQRAKQLRTEGWTVKVRKWDFSGMGAGVTYTLEASRPRQEEAVK